MEIFALTTVIAALIAVAFGWLFARLWHQRLKNRNRSGKNMQDAWNAWTAIAAPDTEERKDGGFCPADTPTAIQDSVHAGLIEFEAKLLTDPTPFETVRQELMDSLDRRQLNLEILDLPQASRAALRNANPDIIQTDEAAKLYVAANDMHLAVLREYSGLRFCDRIDGDWFDVYEKASRMRQRGTRNYIERTLAGSQSANDEARFQAMALMDKELRARLLRVPAGTRFPGFGKAPRAATKRG